MTVFPVFVYVAAEAEEVGGYLFYNAFGKRWLSRRQQAEVEEIAAGLRAASEAGRLGEIEIGWPGDGRMPLNAASDAEIAAEWYGRAYVTTIKLDRAKVEAVAERGLEVE